MRYLNLIIYFLLISTNSFAQKNQKKIEIINADFTYVNNKSHPDYWRLIGNVNIRHNQTDMFCDSAHYFSEKEKIIAYENVKVKKGDSINISGDILNYDGENISFNEFQLQTLEEKKLSEVWGAEATVYMPGAKGFAGTADCIGIYENRATILDFKQIHT